MTIFVKDDLRASVEAASGGRQTVLYTAKGQPTFMNVIPRFNLEDIDPELGTGPHPAFIVGDKEIPEFFVGTYQGIIKNGELLSLPGVNPTRSQAFDTFVEAGRACGNGFHLMTNAEWAAIQLWCMRNGFQPRGNTQYGRSHESTFETGRVITGGVPGDSSSANATLTGSGPASWRHDNSTGGIADLVGNIWEWVGGVRLQDGEIQILPNNDAALESADMGEKSSHWQAIQLLNGALVSPGMDGTAKYDATSESDTTPRLNSEVLFQKGETGDNGNTEETSGNTHFRDLVIAPDVTIPVILKLLGLVPHIIGNQKNKGLMSCRNHGERFVARGGYWVYGASAGLSSMSMSEPRGGRGLSRGARVARV